MKTDMDRFLAKVDKAHGCWNWTASCFWDGYGGANLKGKKQKAHRASWVLFNGPIPEDLFVLHSCDNKICVNPDHLFLGTQLDNMRDKVSKNRQSKGELNGKHKLSEHQVLEIRRLYATGEYTHKELAEKYNVFGSHVGNVVNRKCWKHLPS